MKIIPSLLALFLLPAAVQAAITVTISPGLAGTRFSVTQTSANPTLVFDSVTAGFIASIALAPLSFGQDPADLGYTATFAPTVGLLTDVIAGGSTVVDGFQFMPDFETILYRPVLDLQNTLVLGPGQSHRLEFTNSVTSEISINFARFVEGTYVESDPLFGTVTTVVVPEPATALLGLLAPVLLIGRRRR